MTPPPAVGTPPAPLPTAGMVTRPRCCLTEKWSWSEAMTEVMCMARRYMIRPAAVGVVLADLSPPRVLITRPRCCPTAKCWSREATMEATLRVRNFTIRLPTPSVPSTPSPPRAKTTPPPCCPTARCWSREGGTPTAGPAPIPPGWNSTTRWLAPGAPPVRLPPRAHFTQPPCCLTDPCSSRAATTAVIWPARKCTIRRPERAAPQARSPTRASDRA